MIFGEECHHAYIYSLGPRDIGRALYVAVTATRRCLSTLFTIIAISLTLRDGQSARSGARSRVTFIAAPRFHFDAEYRADMMTQY